MLLVYRGLPWIFRVLYRLEVPVCTEVFSQNRVIWLDDFAALDSKLAGIPEYIQNINSLTTTFKSFEKLKRTTANIRSNGSSESLILNTSERQYVIYQTIG